MFVFREPTDPLANHSIKWKIKKKKNHRLRGAHSRLYIIGLPTHQISVARIVSAVDRLYTRTHTQAYSYVLHRRIIIS